MNKKEQIVSIDSYLDGIVNFTYNRSGLLKSEYSNGYHYMITYSYNEKGYLKERRYRNTNYSITFKYQFNKNGFVVKKTSSRGEVITYQYKKIKVNKSMKKRIEKQQKALINYSSNLLTSLTPYMFLF